MTVRAQDFVLVTLRVKFIDLYVYWALYKYRLLLKVKLDYKYIIIENQV